MLRRSTALFKVSRKWSSDRSKNVTSRHFPLEVAPDPVTLRDSTTGGAKETKSFIISKGDITHDGWAGRMLRHLKAWADLIRLDKQVGTHLLYVPCLWGTALATTRALVYEGADPVVLCAPFVPIHLLISFYLGAFTMRSAGCIVNDMWDRDYDRKVERTMNRPLASGAISMPQASGILGAHIFLGGVILLNLSPAAIQASLLSVPIVIVYPLMKRFTHMPQLVLGWCFNAGIFIGYAAVLNRVDLSVTVPMYVAATCWTVLYDTIYAYQDKKDDVKVGVKSTAILFGDSKMALYVLQIPVGVGFALAGLASPQSLFYYMGLAGSMYYLNNVVDHVNIHDGWSCANGFRRNVRFSIMILFSLMAGNAFWAYASEYNPKKDKQSISDDSALTKVLSLHNDHSYRSYDANDFSWVDRFLKPAFVQGVILAQRGVNEYEVVIPAWMRREYLGENVSKFIRWATEGHVDKSVIDEWESWWYSLVDHYNIFAFFSV